jgi:VWFA-related protein
MLLPTARANSILSNLSTALLRLFVGALLCANFFSATAQAQEPTEDEVLKVRTDLLVFPIRVRDRRRTGAPELAEADVSVSDKDKVTNGVYLYHGTDRVALLFALDESGSLRELIAQQRDAALGLFKQFGSRSQVAVLRFAERPALVSGFGRDTDSVSRAFDFPARPNQHTAIFDAAVAAVRSFDALPHVRSERRIVVLISDGLDNASSTRANAIIDAARGKQISFYVIHLPLFEPRDGVLVVRPPAKGFRELAERTGGKYFLAGNVRQALLTSGTSKIDLGAIFKAIEDDLNAQYLLGLYAGEGTRDGREHRLSVSFPDGVEYQVGDRGYARTHKFVVKAGGTPKPTN